MKPFPALRAFQVLRIDVRSLFWRDAVAVGRECLEMLRIFSTHLIWAIIHLRETG